MEGEANESCEFDADSLIVRADLTITGGVKSVGPAVDQIMGIVGQMGCALSDNCSHTNGFLSYLARTSKIGMLPVRRTLSATLPNVQRTIPVRP